MNENGHNYPRQINPVLCLDLADAVPHVRFEVAVPGPKKKKTKHHQQHSRGQMVKDLCRMQSQNKLGPGLARIYGNTNLVVCVAL